MPDADMQEKKPAGFSELPIHAPIPIKQFESTFWKEYMAEQQVACVYTVSSLLHLGKTLPKLLCNIAKFNACAFEGEILRYKGKVASPSSFPAVSYRLFSDIPSYELSRRHDVGLEKLGSRVKGVSQNELRLRNPGDIKSNEEKSDFVCWVGRVTSPSHNRVTAGGRVVPVIPPPPRPAFANLVAPGPMTFGPPLHDNNVRQTIVPPRPYVPVPTGWEVVWIEDQVYLAPQQVGIPAPHPYPVSSLSQPKLSNANYGLQRPLMNVTNAVMPQLQQPTMQQVIYHQAQLAGQQQPATAGQLQAEQGVWNDYLRANYFEEQSRQARLRRVNGPAPNAVEQEATQENIKKWNGILASNGKEFISTSRKAINYGSPSTKTTRDRAEVSRANPVNMGKSGQLSIGDRNNNREVSQAITSPVALAGFVGEDRGSTNEITDHSAQDGASDVNSAITMPADIVKENKAEVKEDDRSQSDHVVETREYASVVSKKLAEKNLGFNGKMSTNNGDAKKAVPVSERGKAAREAIAIFLQEQLKGRNGGANRMMQKGKSTPDGAAISCIDKIGKGDTFV
ncbi:hypothetical protein GP486_001811 [Trichoglossum hirsutum]|uniref:Uncharacterized protein n=1 Tax=Trichoglossum hirsutum TaxID=265104 RepID=A0A9P8RSQ8_9PEZI|nr:hypothetical protein GP486_001811 [Trichoglossum hirsutum]